MGRPKGSKNGIRKTVLLKKTKKTKHVKKNKDQNEAINQCSDPFFKPLLPVFESAVLRAYRVKKYRKCIALIDEILLKNHEQNKNHYKILKAASITMLGEDFNAAHSILDEVLLADTSNSFAMYGHGVAFYFENKLDESVRAFNRAITANPGEQMERARQMKMRIDLERRKAVIRIEKIREVSDVNKVESLTDVVTADFGSPEITNNDFESYEAQMKTPLRSRKLSSKSRQLSFSDEDDQDESMTSKENTEEPGKKESRLSTEKLFKKGMKSYKNGLLKKASKMFSKVLKTNPKMTEADEMATKVQELLQLMEVAATNMSQKNYEAVVEILNEALEIDKSNDHVNRPFYFQRGLAYFYLGNNEESLKDYAIFDRINKLLREK